MINDLKQLGFSFLPCLHTTFRQRVGCLTVKGTRWPNRRNIVSEVKLVLSLYFTVLTLRLSCSLKCQPSPGRGEGGGGETAYISD